MDDKKKTQLNKEFYTIGEVCKLLGVHHDTLRRWDKSGKLRAVRVGAGSWRRYKREDIIKLLNLYNET